MAVCGSERGYWILDLHPKASRNADLRRCPNSTERIPVSRLLRLIWLRELEGLSHQRRHVAITLLSEKTDAAMIPPMTTKGATGLFFRKIFPRGHANDRNIRFQRRVSTRNRYSRLSSIIGAYHAGVFCIPLPTHVRPARDYRPHVDRATPGDPPCRSATPSPEVVRSIC